MQPIPSAERYHSWAWWMLTGSTAMSNITSWKKSVEQNLLSVYLYQNPLFQSASSTASKESLCPPNPSSAERILNNYITTCRKTMGSAFHLSRSDTINGAPKGPRTAPTPAIVLRFQFVGTEKTIAGNTDPGHHCCPHPSGLVVYLLSYVIRLTGREQSNTLWFSWSISETGNLDSLVDHEITGDINLFCYINKQPEAAIRNHIPETSEQFSRVRHRSADSTSSVHRLKCDCSMYCGNHQAVNPI